VAYVPPFPSRDELLTMAMLELARERGVHDMTIRTLASTVRAAPGSLTYHHGSKDALLATCARFLGFWLDRDLEERVATGGGSSLFPDTGTPDTGTPDTGTPDTGTPDTGTPDTRTGAADDEREYARRLRVWVQLSAYALDSPVVAPPVRAGEDRMAATLTGHGDRSASAAERLARWATFKTLVTMLLQPDAALTKAEALSAWACVTTA
jgi:AcrR family transcriptional regulator